ncbi:hypothetical protein NKI51_28945 [Mesorhizobium australicum]|uniref:hypothetical protein n=1 Tax=Mesorhizobium australicum TaxID=536018 RepID=UPI003338159F
MGEGSIIKLKEDELLTFVRSCFQWQNADVFAFGRRHSISRLGEIAGYIAMMSDKDGNPRASSIKIVLPPAGGRDRERMLKDVHEGVQRAYRRFEKDDTRTAPFVDATIARLEIDQAADFTSASLGMLLDNAKGRQGAMSDLMGGFRRGRSVRLRQALLAGVQQRCKTGVVPTEIRPETSCETTLCLNYYSFYYYLKLHIRN